VIRDMVSIAVTSMFDRLYRAVREEVVSKLVIGRVSQASTSINGG